MGRSFMLVPILGSVFGVLGALLLAMPAMPGWGFGAFIVSNVAWLIVSAWQRQWPLHLQQWVFLAGSGWFGRCAALQHRLTQNGFELLDAPADRRLAQM